MAATGEHQAAPNPNQHVIDALEHEINNINPEFTPTIFALLESELFKLRGGINEVIDLSSGRWVKIRTKVALPNAPNVNVVGRLLGPRGENMKNLQTSTKTKMSILGQGSMRDPQKEQEHLASGDPKYQHLKQALHLQIDCLADASEAYYRMSHAIAEVQKCMIEASSQAEANGGGYGPPRGGGGDGFRGSRGGRGQRGGRGGRGGGPPGGYHAPPPLFQDGPPMDSFGGGYEGENGGGVMRGRGRGGPPRGRGRPY